MLIIPSIDLKDGKVVDIIKSEEDYKYYYNQLSSNPVDLCKLWRSENAKTLHINDLDGTENSPNKQVILDIIDCLDIPITLSSRSNSIEYCESFLERGIFRVALFRFLVDNPPEAIKLIEKYSASRIIFYALTKGKELQIWGENPDITFEEYLELLASVGAQRLIYGEEDWKDTGRSPDYTFLKSIFVKYNFKLTLYGGIHSYLDLKELQNHNEIGIDSVILSKPLYENNFPCQEIWRLAETS